MQHEQTSNYRQLLNLFREALADPYFRSAFAELTLHNLSALLQVEPLFNADFCVRFIPCTKSNLRDWVHKLDLPKRYRLVGTEHRRQHMFYAHEVVLLRSKMIRGKLSYVSGS